MLTLAEAKDSALANISGVCTTGTAFLQLLNDATRRLMRRGDWVGTVVRIQVCVRKGCLVFPRYVGQVRKLNVCKKPIEVRNMWWEFVSERDDDYCGANIGMRAQGKTPTFDSVRGDERVIRAYPLCQVDIGKTIKFFGVDNNGQTLRTQNANGTWSEGITLSLQAPYTASSAYVSRIDRIIKEETNCPVYVYAYDAANDALEEIGSYEPSETLPQYERYHLEFGCGTACDQTKSVLALVKLKYIPAKHDTDLVLIQNLDALGLMMQSIKFQEANDRVRAREYEADAIRELNLELTDNQPDDQMPISMGALGHSGIGTQRLF